MVATTIAPFYRKILEQAYREADGVVRFDPANPYPLPEPMRPGPDSPICQKCGLFEQGCRHPFFEPYGSTDPLLTVVIEGVSRADDAENAYFYGNPSAILLKNLTWLAEDLRFDLSRVRWVPMVRCGPGIQPVNVRIKGNWCRHFLVEDLIRHRPRAILAVGTSVLGLLHHKSNAQDWQGFRLQYRGWPDDWLTKEEFCEPRPHPSDPEATVQGHYVLGTPPDWKTPLVGVIAPGLVLAKRNPRLLERWRLALKYAMELATSEAPNLSFQRPWYRFYNDPAQVEAGLQEILRHPGLRVSYDTETTGLRPLAEDAAIVSMMFRWEDPATGEPQSLGFPWNFQSRHYDNQVFPARGRLTPLVLQVLTQSELVCHNATFDFLYSYFNLKQANLKGLRPGTREYNLQADANLCALADAFIWDTWHMAYTFQQERGTLGLEMMAYRFVPDMAGYEEDMTLLISRLGWQLDPGAKKSPEQLMLLSPDEAAKLVASPEAEAEAEARKALVRKAKKKTKKQITEERAKEEPNPHYLNIGEEYYPTHVVPYVMGDVETCYQARDVLEGYLHRARLYSIPIGNPDRPGTFKPFQVPGREWLYTHIMSPAARFLMKIMARGMHVDQEALRNFEDEYPKKILEKLDVIASTDPRVALWCAEKKSTEEGWELDLENKAHLRHIIFTLMGLPVQRLTKTGRRLFGETPEDWAQAKKDGIMVDGDELKFAALDKFTLNKLAVDHPEVRPMQDYRQLFKLYTTYIRPLRNAFDAAVDKKRRVADQHLCSDGKVHASFLMASTRSGRIASQRPNLQQLPSRGNVKSMFTSRFGKRGCIYASDLCLAYGQRIWTRRGLLKVEDVVAGDLVEQEDGTWRRVVAFADRGLKAVWRLTTEGGYTFEATPDHRIRILDAEGAYVWARLQDLKIGDYVALQPGRPVFGGKVQFPPMTPKTWHRQLDVVGMSEATPDFCFWFGFLLGNGSLSRKTWSLRYVVCDRDPDVADYLGGISSTFGLHLNRKAYRGVLEHRGHSSRLARWLIQDLHWSKKHIPEWVYQLDAVHLGAFLRGLFESDGSSGVGDVGARSNGQRISFTSVHASFAKEIQVLLLRLGVHCGRRYARNKRRGGWTVIVRADSVPTFMAHVGFQSERKKRISADYAERVAVGKKFGLPNQQGFIADTWLRGELYRLTHSTRNRGTVVTAPRAQAILDAGAEGELRSRLERFIRSGQRYERIKMVEYVGICPTCDLQVEETQSFVASGFVSHNSQIELRLMAAISGDPTMVKAFHDKIDLHTLTTSKIYKRPYEHFSKEHFQWLQEHGREAEAKELELMRRIGKCVDPRTLVSVQGQIVRIGSLHAGREADTFYPLEGLAIQSPGGTTPLRSFYSNGASEAYLVCTRRGLVACSANHRFTVENRGLVRAVDLKKGDVVTWTPLESDSVPPEIPFDPFGTDRRTGHNVIKVNGPLAYVLGLFYGDGTSSEQAIAITTGGGELYAAWQDQVAEALVAVGFEPRIKRLIEYKDGKSGMVFFGSRRVLDYFFQLEAVDEQRRRTLQIPAWLLNADPEIKLEFLAGLLDTDGGCSASGGLELTTKSWVFAQDLMVLMGTLGFRYTLDPTFNKTYSRYYYRIRLCMEDSWKIKPWLRLRAKFDRLTEPKVTYAPKPNCVQVVIPLGCLPLVDVEVEASDHLYLANGLPTHNTANFLTGYGGGAFGLQTVLANSNVYKQIEECEEIIALFFDTYPTLYNFLRKYKAFIVEHAVAVSVFGRVRVFEEMYGEDEEAKSKALRAGCNHVIQSTASDMMLIALMAIEELMRQEGLESILITTVHDSLAVDAVRDELPQLHDIVFPVLNNFGDVLAGMFGDDYDQSWLTVPILGDCDVGPSYYDLRKIPEKNIDWDKLLDDHHAA